MSIIIVEAILLGRYMLVRSPCPNIIILVPSQAILIAFRFILCGARILRVALQVLHEVVHDILVVHLALVPLPLVLLASVLLHLVHTVLLLHLGLIGLLGFLVHRVRLGLRLGLGLRIGLVGLMLFGLLGIVVIVIVPVPVGWLGLSLVGVDLAVAAFGGQGNVGVLVGGLGGVGGLLVIGVVVVVLEGLLLVVVAPLLVVVLRVLLVEGGLPGRALIHGGRVALRLVGGRLALLLEGTLPGWGGVLGDGLDRLLQVGCQVPIV